MSGIGKGGVISGALFLGRCVALAILFVTGVETMGCVCSCHNVLKMEISTFCQVGSSEDFGDIIYDSGLSHNFCRLGSSVVAGACHCRAYTRVILHEPLIPIFEFEIGPAAQYCSRVTLEIGEGVCFCAVCLLTL